jgi:hypothetical protein
MKKFVEHLLKKCNGDIEFAQKITANNAKLAEDTERFHLEMEIFQELEVLAAKQDK